MREEAQRDLGDRTNIRLCADATRCSQGLLALGSVCKQRRREKFAGPARMRLRCELARERLDGSRIIQAHEMAERPLVDAPAKSAHLDTSQQIWPWVRLGEQLNAFDR